MGLEKYSYEDWLRILKNVDLDIFHVIGDGVRWGHSF